MITRDMRFYNYYTYSSFNEYKQPQLSTEPQGAIKMAINTISQNTQDNIKYKDCTYIGLTYNTDVNDTFVIDYNGEKLKVLYVNSKGKLKQVMLKNI